MTRAETAERELAEARAEMARLTQKRTWQQPNDDDLSNAIARVLNGWSMFNKVVTPLERLHEQLFVELRALMNRPALPANGGEPMSCAHDFDQWCKECIDGVVQQYNTARRDLASMTAERDALREELAKADRAPRTQSAASEIEERESEPTEGDQTMTPKELKQAAIDCLAKAFKGDFESPPPHVLQAATAIVLTPEVRLEPDRAQE